MGISDKIPAGTGLLPESTLTEASGPDVKGTVKDSVFRDLFGERKYAFQLYQALHPEDVDATEADIGDVTIHNVFTDQEYNDLGMTIRGKVLVMLEAQTSWTMNIIVRILLYLAHIPSVNKGALAPSTVFWRLAALTSIGVRPVRLIPLPCQPPKYGTWGPKEFCASDL